MKKHRIGIIMNGVTGRMGRNQHLFRSILAIRQQGGVRLNDQESIYPEVLLVGRNASKLRQLSNESGLERWTTDLDQALADSQFPVYFDALATSLRVETVSQAISAGKHIYCEKPTALNSKGALALYQSAIRAGVKHGVVQDKLWLPGILKLKSLIKNDFFGEILAIRGEFGYWVFDGFSVDCQRPSWNYRREEGGGIIQDMFPHWCYLFDDLFGGIRSVCCLAKTHVPRRVDEKGCEYQCTADDAVYAVFQLETGAVAQFNSSWAVRVRRDDLLTIQVDGSKGSAVAGLRDCWIQPLNATPRPVWNPDIESPIDYREDWIKVPPQRDFDNAFKAQWELFLRHVVADEDFRWDLMEGARGVQLAELGLESSRKQCWMDIPALT